MAESTEKTQKSAQKEVRVPCYLYSKANYPIRIRYNGEDLMLPSFAHKVLIEDEAKLGVLPAKVRKVTLKEEK